MTPARHPHHHPAGSPLHPRQDQGHLAGGRGTQSKELYAHPAPEIQEGTRTTTYSEVNITQGQWVSEKPTPAGSTITASTSTTTPQVHRYGPHLRQHSDTRGPGSEGGQLTRALLHTAESEPRGVSTYLIPPTPSSCMSTSRPRSPAWLWTWPARHLEPDLVEGKRETCARRPPRSSISSTDDHRHVHPAGERH